MARLVEDDELRLTRVSGLMGAVNETAGFAGPALGGVLVALLGPERVLVVDALSYLAAFLLVAVLVRPAGVASDGSSEGGLLRGLRYIARRTILRRQVVGVGAINLGLTGLFATLPVLALHHGGPAVAGWMLASYDLGSRRRRAALQPGPRNRGAHLDRRCVRARAGDLGAAGAASAVGGGGHGALREEPGAQEAERSRRRDSDRHGRHHIARSTPAVWVVRALKNRGENTPAQTPVVPRGRPRQLRPGRRHEHPRRCRRRRRVGLGHPVSTPEAEPGVVLP